MKVIRLLLYLLLVPVGAFILFLIFATVDDFKPVNVELKHDNEQVGVIPDTAALRILIWNIGYGGLDASMDFFYDGGARMRPDKEGVLENLKGIISTLSPYSNYDFLLLQEVDRDSRRSYHFDQYEILGQHFQHYNGQFATNYDVAFVPIPIREPMGQVNSGLVTLSKYEPAAVTRHSFPGNYSWPMKLFMLDRCFLVNRYPVEGDKELVVVNTHNSAYDDGTLRQQQMGFLKEFLVAEQRKGNYLIVGGDWNQSPHGLEPQLPSHQFDTLNLTYIEKDYPVPGWKWAFDPDLPTNRRVAVPYRQSTSLTTIIDYYLLSPNISVQKVETRNTEFEFSDHQPVSLFLKLIP